MKIPKTRLKQIIKEELQVILTNEEVEEMFGEEVRRELEMDERKENNPWAICTASVGRKDKEKYEKCVMDVKKDNKK